MKTLIKNGLVVDPATHTQKVTNVLMEDGFIKSLTNEEPPCDDVYDAKGCIVSPGFIDIHMHEDAFHEDTHTFENDIAPCMLRMGVTTMVGGNCGSNLNNPARYLDWADQYGTPSNIALFAGHSTIRAEVTDKSKYDHTTPLEMAKMAKMAEEWIAAGCVGISYGIRYVPGSTFEELTATAKACTQSGKMLSAHIRDDAAYVFKSLDEFLKIAKCAHTPAEVSHIGSMAGFGQMEEFLKILAKERREGMDVHADCYPYYAFSTEIGETTYDDGFLERYGIDYDVIELCEGKYKGQRCNEAIFKELRENEPNTLTVCHVMRPKDVDLAVCDKDVAIGSDGVLSHSQGHPRAAGAFPKYLHDYVATGRLSLMDGLAKITSLPAQRLHLTGRGTLAAGSHADITIFKLDEIKDHSTFDQPVLPPSGIKAVFVNGVMALKDNEILSLCAGRSVRG